MGAQAIDDEGMPRPLANYSHGMVSPPGARLVTLSGQVAVLDDGGVPETCEAQTGRIFEQIERLLLAAGSSMDRILKVNAYLTDRADVQGYMAARDRHVAQPPPASTLLIVTGFVRPEFKVEVEVLAYAL